MKPRPLNDALEFVRRKGLNTSEWDSEKWAGEGPDVKTKAFFSARVESARFLHRAKRLIEFFMAKSIEDVTLPDGTKGKALKVGSREDFVLRMREFMVGEGMMTRDEWDEIRQDSGADNDITDVRGRRRLELIFDTTVRSAWGFAHWKQGMVPAVLKRFPAAKFVRVPGAKEPRPVHVENEEEVRLKSDVQFWAKEMNAAEIGGFEVPWAPYGFNSYMEQQDVSRARAEELGLLKPGEPVKGVDRNLNDGLKASVKKMDPKLRKKLIDDLKKERAGNSKPGDIRDEAKNAARAARRDAIERSLERARKRGEFSEVRRIELILKREFPEARTADVVVMNDQIVLKPVAPVPDVQSLESFDDFRERVLAKKDEFGKRVEELERSLEIAESRQEMALNIPYAQRIKDPKRWNDLLDRIAKRIWKKKVALSEAGVELIALPVSETGTLGFNDGKRPKRGFKARGVELLEAVVHKELVEKTVIEFGRNVSRSKQVDLGTYGFIQMRATATPAVVVHEIVHQVERRMLIDESRKFLKMRAGSEKVRPLSDFAKGNYGPDERGYEDDFMKLGSPGYAGKVYGSSHEKAFATELLTIGIERAMANPVDFAERDPDYFEWVIKLLQRRS